VAPRGTSIKRRGSVLYVVLVVIVLLSLGAYSFSELMISEYQGVEMSGRDAQARALAESGVEMAAAILRYRDEATIATLYHNPAVFNGMLVVDSEFDRGRGRFTIVAAVESDTSGTMIRYGLIDESAKLNLNTILQIEPLPEEDEESSDDTTTPGNEDTSASEDESVLVAGVEGAVGEVNQAPFDVLMQIPGMTEEAADSILDWLDEDTEPRQFGAEDSTYQGLTPPYLAKNGPIESLDELLLVNGVTPQLLYGEDANRNGLLDPNENDGDASLPADNADGVLDLGWQAYFTVYSRESNLDPEGLPRIDVNDSSLEDLYDQLAEALGEDQAQFIVAFRMYGPVVEEEDNSGGATRTLGNQQTNQQLQQAASAVAQTLASGGDVEPVIKGGLEVSRGASFEFESLYELIDAEVTGEVDGRDETLTSPWSTNSGSLTADLALLFDYVSTSAEPYIEGRINVNQARPEVLVGLPGMTLDIIEGIVAGSMFTPGGEVNTGLDAQRSTTAWLLTEGIVDLETLQNLDRYITARGDVYRLQSLGHFDRGGPIARIEAVIDATVDPPKVVFRRNLTPMLGPGYPLVPPEQ